MLRRDLEAAGIPYADECGQIADFHSFRHTFATLLVKAGVSLAAAQRLMRHSDPKLTANIYTHTLLPDKARELAKLPHIRPALTDKSAPRGGALGKTGTEDTRPFELPPSSPSMNATARTMSRKTGRRFFSPIPNAFQKQGKPRAKLQ